MVREIFEVRVPVAVDYHARIDHTESPASLIGKTTATERSFDMY